MSVPRATCIWWSCKQVDGGKSRKVSIGTKTCVFEKTAKAQFLTLEIEDLEQKPAYVQDFFHKPLKLADFKKKCLYFCRHIAILAFN